MLIQNAIKITENHPEETFLVSANRHDFKQHTFKNGKTVAVDGGTEYVRRCYTDKSDYGTDWMEWCVDDTEPLYAIKEKLLWGSHGKSGKEPLKYVLLKNCESEHLENIIIHLKELVAKRPAWKKSATLYNKVIKSILKDRKSKKK